jgi:hypothetical protein
MPHDRDETHFYVNVESFLPAGMDEIKENISIRPLPGQSYPQTMMVDCQPGLVKNHPLGTRFKITVQVVDDGNGLGAYLKVPTPFPYEVIR